MNKRSWIVLFSIILITNITGGLLKNQLVDYISKPLIVVSLAGYFLFQTREMNSALRKWILLAMFFSWTGDILFMFQQNDRLFFLAGLSAFLVAHIFYIIFFHQLRIKEKIKGNIWFLVIVVVYYLALIIFLSPRLGDMKLPVRAYGIVISFMLMLAMHMLFIKNKEAGRLMMTGALLFLISDSVLAVNMFYQSFAAGGVIIMLTYGLAQLFIVEGAIRYITFNRKE